MVTCYFWCYEALSTQHIQVYDTLSLTIFAMLCIKSQGVIHLTTESLYPLTNNSFLQ
jgi:hypothetical protein